MDTRTKDNTKRKFNLPDACRPVAEPSPIPMAAVEGSSQVIRYANAAFCLLLGRPEEELIGDTLSAVLQADDEFLSLVERVYRTGQAEIYTGQEQHSASALFWSYAMWPISAADGRTIGTVIQVTETVPSHEFSVAMRQALMIGSVRQHELTEAAETANVGLRTEIAQGERVQEDLRVHNLELRQSRDFVQSIVDSVWEPLIVLDTELRIKSANKAFFECFQAAPGGTEGQFLYRVEEGLFDSPELRRLLSEVLPSYKSFERFELERDSAKIGHKILLVSARQLDSVQMILFSINDITERRNAEAALRRTEEFLRHAQKMEAIGRLAGGVAHDFNNLLTGILGCSDLLLDSVDTGDYRQQRENLQVIRQSAERAAELTKQLLAFSRRQVLRPEVLTLRSLIGDLERMLRRVIGEQIELVVDLDAPGAFIRADPGQISQVVMNLCLNARDAMFHGGTLTIRIKTLDVLESSRYKDLEPGRYVVLVVSDTGVGMDRETQSHLFEPFFTTKCQGRGTGLGLATVFGILEQSGAHIRFASELGHGTTFEVFFPRVAEPVTIPEGYKSHPPSVSPSKAPTGSEIVLVAEDEDSVRNLARRFLESKGYKVLEAKHGVEALAVCKSHRHIDLLLTDVRMPVMGGRELAEQAAKLHPEMKIIFMSAYTDDSLIAEGVEMRGIPFLQKPFTLPGLAYKVREVLDSKGKDQRTKAKR